MQWQVIGANRATGADQTLTIEADTEDSAMRRANRRGLVVTSVIPLDIQDSVSGVPALPQDNFVIDDRPNAAPQVVYMQAPPQMPAYAAPSPHVVHVIKQLSSWKQNRVVGSRISQPNHSRTWADLQGQLLTAWCGLS